MASISNRTLPNLILMVFVISFIKTPPSCFADHVTAAEDTLPLPLSPQVHVENQTFEHIETDTVTFPQEEETPLIPTVVSDTDKVTSTNENFPDKNAKDDPQSQPPPPPQTSLTTSDVLSEQEPKPNIRSNPLTIIAPRFSHHRTFLTRQLPPSYYHSQPFHPYTTGQLSPRAWMPLMSPQPIMESRMSLMDGMSQAASIVPKFWESGSPFWTPHAYFNLCPNVRETDPVWSHGCNQYPYTMYSNQNFDNPPTLGVGGVPGMNPLSYATFPFHSHPFQPQDYKQPQQEQQSTQQQQPSVNTNYYYATGPLSIYDYTNAYGGGYTGIYGGDVPGAPPGLLSAMLNAVSLAPLNENAPPPPPPPPPPTNNPSSQPPYSYPIAYLNGPHVRLSTRRRSDAS